MPNPYFSFKQFTVYHDRCAMKVGTDGVLIGGWANNDNALHILDVGAGSGLVSLMLAQRFPEATVASIEIDEEACKQANENYADSLFDNLSDCKCISYQEFCKISDQKFDLIVSNPPFFSRSLKSPDQQRTTARHTDSLLIEEFIMLSAKMIAPDGSISFVFPESETENLIEIAENNNLHVTRITKVLPTPSSEPKRVLMELSPTDKTSYNDELIVEMARHQYSPQFIAMMKDFYLKM